jgi:hypothetical protein
MQFFSEITGECTTQSAFARALAARQIGLCPSLLTLGTKAQARALLLEVLHVGGIGGNSAEKDCRPGCGALCGTVDNAKAWLQVIECSAGS